MMNGMMENQFYQMYLNLLPEKEQKLKLSVHRHNTFLVFHSGKIIMSGLCELFMKDIYYKFLDIINECHNEIEEKLITNQNNFEISAFLNQEEMEIQRNTTIELELWTNQSNLFLLFHIFNKYIY